MTATELKPLDVYNIRLTAEEMHALHNLFPEIVQQKYRIVESGIKREPAKLPFRKDEWTVEEILAREG